ncbi:hypothetical protein RCL1_002096 [Eukaryota sp. TZLM3-RCL]
MMTHLNEILQDHGFLTLRTIGSGTQGKVFLARNNDGELKCIKRIAKGLRMSIRELQVLSSLSSCQHLIRYEDYFEDEDFYYVITEYCEGGNLESLIKIEQLSVADIWSIFVQTLIGIKMLHDQNIIHRDIKLENILLTSTQRPFRVKICDFGVSRTNDANAPPMTFCGTQPYMSPQLFLNQPYSFDVDYYSLGVCLFRLITRSYPFFSQIEVLSSYNVPKTNTEFDFIITGLLERAVEKRFTYDSLYSFPAVQQAFGGLRKQFEKKEEVVEDDVDYEDIVRQKDVKIDELTHQVHVMDKELLRLSSRVMELEELMDTTRGDSMMTKLMDRLAVLESIVRPPTNTATSSYVGVSGLRRADTSSLPPRVEPRPFSELRLESSQWFQSHRICFDPDTSCSAVTFGSDRCLVRKERLGWVPSVARIIHPALCVVRCKLEDPRRTATVMTYIGFGKFQDDTPEFNSFTGLYLSNDEAQWVDHSEPGFKFPFSKDEEVIVRISGHKCDFMFGRNEMKKSFDVSQGYTFGLAMLYPKTAWVISGSLES